MRSILTLLFLAAALSACREHAGEPPPERAFYYWKAVYAPTASDLAAVDSLHLKTRYIKFFDVDRSPAGVPTPVATIRFAKPVDSSGQVIPTVFITQACMNALRGADVDSLAMKIGFLISQIIDYEKLRHVSEIQIDCDWTARNSNEYFALLKAFRKQPVMRGKQLSATIRLYQLKFISKVGIPPVDRGMLMCYNMGDLTDPNAKNSILDIDVLRQYASSMKVYPLPLDVALPIFEWAVLFRDGRYKALIRDLDPEALAGVATKRSETEFAVRTDTLLHGYALKFGDVIRFEKVSAGALDEAAKLAADNLVHTPGRVAFFHLDSSAIATYHVETLDRVYRRFE